ncbi:unnamed protein product [Aphanomyces euteiches]
MAIVPFSYTSPFHAAHADPERHFHFEDVSITIKQEWKPDGRGGTQLGFGAHVYNAAILLAFYVLRYEVLATDGDDQVVDLAQFNINANGVASTCHAAKHLWGTDMDSLGDVDVVLGADIIACPYEGAYDDLLASLRHFVRGATVALIAYKRRHSSEVKFFHKLKRDFEWTTIPHDEYHEDFRHLDIDLLSIRAKSHGEA